MAEKIAITNETVEGAVDEVAAVQTGNLEFRLIDPKEGGFLQRIKWNKEELEAAVRQKIAEYQNVVYTDDNMKQAKADRAELNKLAKAIDERRKMVKKIISEPYDTFETELKDILALIREPVGIIDKQVKAFEEQQKEAKKKDIRAAYDGAIGDLQGVLPFEKVFDIRYLNQTYKLATAQADVRAKIEKVRTDLETIDGLDSKYKLNAKDVYIRTLDLSQALAENKRLSDLEEKLEAEKRRKAAEEDERKRLEEERRKKAEERARRAEEERKAQEEERKANIGRTRGDTVFAGRPVGIDGGSPESVSRPAGSVIESPQSVSRPVWSVSDTEPGTGNAVRKVEEPQEDQPSPEEKKLYITRFYAKGTRDQLNKLVQFMGDNGIEYGRINA